MTAEPLPGPGIFGAPPRGGRIEDLEAVARFHQRYQNLVDAHAWRRVELFKEAFAQFRPPLAELLDRAREEDRRQARNFNLFQVLHLEAREELVHTPLLAHMLDPKGSHGQGLLFLHAFMDALTVAHGDFPAPVEALDAHAWFVEAHKYIGHGAPDIVVACPGLGFLLVVENNVFADDDDGQLARDATWMESQREAYPSQALVYLTPAGEEAESAPGTAYYRASYPGEVAAMLKAALPEIGAPHLRETVRQYLEVIQNF